MVFSIPIFYMKLNKQNIIMHKKKLKKLTFLIFLSIHIACLSDKSSITNIPNEQNHYNRFIYGYVELEHQTNHNNCAVFLDQLNVGTYTDSSGFYSITIPDSLCSNDKLAFVGVVQLYFYSFNFQLDSLPVVIGENGIITDSLAVVSNGKIKQVHLRQVFSIELITDTTYYTIGDTIWMTMFMRKYGIDTIEIDIWNAYSKNIGPVFILYELPYNYFISTLHIDAITGYIWWDSTTIIQLHKYWILSENFFRFLNYPTGFYSFIPHITKSNRIIPQWWRIPKNMECFLPSTKYLNSDYLYHPKKFKTPIVYLDSVQTHNEIWY